MSGAPRPPSGLLLLRGAADSAARWAASGLTPVGVAPVGNGWSVLVPTSAASAVSKPYDDAMTVLLNRPLPRRLRPAIGVAVIRDQAVVVVVPRRWRAVGRWLVWQPGTGLVQPGTLPVARLADLARAAGATDPSAVALLADVVHDPRGDASAVLGDVLEALGLPGRELLAGSSPAAELPNGREVEPSPGRASLFERMVHEDESWRDEMEGHR